MYKNKNNQSISEKADQLISHYLLHPNKNKEQVLAAILTKIEQKEHKTNRKINWYLVSGISAAASIVLLITLYFFTATVVMFAGEDQTVTYRMADNSRVVLYDNSTIIHRKYVHKREMELTGEAYFEVEKGDGFRVKTKNGETSVLGTRFLVNDRGEDIQVQCFQGKVQTVFKDKSWVLEPGTQFSGDENTGKKSDLTETIRYPDFAQFMKSFTNTPLYEVISEIETFFNVTIELKSGIIKNFSGTIQTGNLESVLQIVCESLQLKYTFENDHTIKIH